MSALLRAPAKAGSGNAARHARALIILVPLLGSLLGGAALAGPPEAVTRLSAEEAEAGGLAIGLVRHDLGSGAALEVQLPPQAMGARLLAAAPDGSSVALADRYGVEQTVLVVAHADGSQARVQMPGLLAAAWAPGGDRLAVIDGRGALWTVDASSGDPHPLADGPFLGHPTVQPDGSMLLLSVSSVEAPILSQLVELDTESGEITSLAEETLVYAAFPMADGSIAVVAHSDGSTVVRRIRGHRDELIADLGPGAIQVAVAPNGRIAFAREASGIFVLGQPGDRPHLLAPGSDPAFDPSGSNLMVRQDGETVVLALDGSTLARVAGDAAFVTCAGECGS